MAMLFGWAAAAVWPVEHDHMCAHPTFRCACLHADRPQLQPPSPCSMLLPCAGSQLNHLQPYNHSSCPQPASTYRAPLPNRCPWAPLSTAIFAGTDPRCQRQWHTSKN
jgi:hypothetical protein